MQVKPYYRCADGCQNCPRRQQCAQAAAVFGADAADFAVQEPPVSSGPAPSAAMAEFLKKYPDRGTLRVQAFRSRQAIPVQGVHVRITGRVGDEDVVFFEGTTDESGLIDAISLPAPSKSLSMTPEDPTPYASYDLTAEHPSFRPLHTTVQLFQGIKTVQPVQLQLKEV